MKPPVPEKMKEMIMSKNTQGTKQWTPKKMYETTYQQVVLTNAEDTTNTATPSMDLHKACALCCNIKTSNKLVVTRLLSYITCVANICGGLHMPNSNICCDT